MIADKMFGELFCPSIKSTGSFLFVGNLKLRNFSNFYFTTKFTEWPSQKQVPVSRLHWLTGRDRAERQNNSTDRQSDHKRQIGVSNEAILFVMQNSAERI